MKGGRSSYMVVAVIVFFEREMVLIPPLSPAPSFSIPHLHQIPFRIALYIRLKDALTTPNQPRAVDKLLELCESFVWKVNQTFGVFLYGWFLLACFLVYKGSDCSGSGLFRICVANLTVFFLHMVLSYVWLRSILQVEGGLCLYFFMLFFFYPLAQLLVVLSFAAEFPPLRLLFC